MILTDNDDLRRVAMLYPGFDVFMADLVGIDLGSTPMARHPVFKTRMVEHTHRNFSGRPDRDLGDLHEPEAHLAHSRTATATLSRRVSRSRRTRSPDSWSS